MRNRWVLAAILVVYAVLGPVNTGRAWFDTPELLEPEDDARFGFESGPIIFTWEDTGAVDYEFVIAVDSEFEVGTIPLSCEGNTFYNLSDLIPDETWNPLNVSIYWRIRAVYTLGVKSAWSESRILHKTELDLPVIIAGEDGRYSHVTGLPYFEWESLDDAISYVMEFATDLEFEDTLVALDLTTSTLDFENVNREEWDSYEFLYYWRVAGMSQDNVPGPWSQTCRISKTTIIPPDPVFPDDGVRLAPRSDPPVMTWSPTEGDGSYQFRLTLDPEGYIDLPLWDVDTETFDFATDLGVDFSGEEWWYLYSTLYWSVASFDDAGRPGPFSHPREMSKIGYRRVAAYGDSITTGVYWESGYMDFLTDHLYGLWPRFSMINMGEGGRKSKWGSDNMVPTLVESCPQIILILFGALDIIDPYHCDPPYDCRLVEHLEEMIQQARSFGTTPILSTLLPVNPAGEQAASQWQVDEYNMEIKAMAASINAPLVDLNALFWTWGENLPELYGDWGHPSVRGYEVMADGFYEGIEMTGI